MRPFIRIIFILIPMLCIGTLNSHAAERKEIVVVMPIAAPDISEGMRTSLTDSFVGELTRAGKYEIRSGKIVKDAMQAVFKKQALKKEQCDETACIKEVADNFGTDLILTIKVIKEEETFFLNAKIENISNGAQVSQKDDECKKCDLSELKKKIKLLAARLMGLEVGETVPAIAAKKPAAEEPRGSGSSLPPPPPTAPAPVVLQGHLQVNVNAPSARVYVNGEEKGTASPGSPLNMENLPTGTASIRVEAEGYESLQKTVTIQRNQWTQEVFELKRIQVASLPPAKSLQETIRSSDGRYIDNRDGTITDTKTGLMWTKKDSYADLGKCLNWYKSKEYVSNLRTGGYNNWRLPTVKELKTIYENSENNKDYSGHTLGIDPIFASGGSSVSWSSNTTSSNSALHVGFIGFSWKSEPSVESEHSGYCGDFGVRGVRR